MNNNAVNPTKIWQGKVFKVEERKSGGANHIKTFSEHFNLGFNYHKIECAFTVLSVYVSRYYISPFSCYTKFDIQVCFQT